MLVSDTELIALRAELASILTDIATINKHTQTSDNAGRFITTSNTTTCKTRVSKQDNAQVVDTNNQIVYKAKYLIILPFDTLINENDTLTIQNLNYKIISITRKTLNLALFIDAVLVV